MTTKRHIKETKRHIKVTKRHKRTTKRSIKETKTQNNYNVCTKLTKVQNDDSDTNMLRRDTQGLGRVTQIKYKEMYKGDKDAKQLQCLYIPMDYKDAKPTQRNVKQLRAQITTDSPSYKKADRTATDRVSYEAIDITLLFKEIQGFKFKP